MVSKGHKKLKMRQEPEVCNFCKAIIPGADLILYDGNLYHPQCIENAWQRKKPTEKLRLDWNEIDERRRFIAWLQHYIAPEDHPKLAQMDLPDLFRVKEWVISELKKRA